MTLHGALGSRGQLGAVLGTQRGGSALPWWNPDGATPAANTAAWCAKGAPSLAGSYVNLGLLGYPNIDPTAVGGVAPNWDALLGWTTPGARYLKSGVVPTATHSLLVQYSSAVSNCLVGSYNGGSTRFGVYSPSGIYMYGGNSIGTVASNGNRAVSEPSGYLNGIFDIALGTFLGVGAELYILARNRADIGGIDAYYVGNLQALVIYNVLLSSAQIGLRAAAMAAL